MNDKKLAIKVEGVSKRYRIGVKEQMHENLGSAIIDVIKSPLKNYRKYRSLYDFKDISDNHAYENSDDILWALRDVSFEVKQGEVLGIIGMNGAGKSTLLKILSRITPPTAGQVQINGRVSSLLEVGTGFHSELTGRENVYLNGTVLGMRKKEIDQKFDEIVEFSGVEKFLDTPVKRYSSGMRVRLAFAVAAHLDPEILIIDEVLAVGDAAFQRKCLNKMQDVGQAGRTVLFVSHSMPAVTRMCERVILLNAGRIMLDSTAHEVVSAYLKGDQGSSAQREWLEPDNAPGGDIARLSAVRIRNEKNVVTDAIDIRRPVRIDIEFNVLKSGHVLLPMLSLWNDEGVKALMSVDLDKTWRKRPRPEGNYISTVTIPGNFLSEGMFLVNVALWTLEPSRIRQFHARETVAFQVIDSMDGTSARGDWTDNMTGVTRPLLDWATQFESHNNGTLEFSAKELVK